MNRQQRRASASNGKRLQKKVWNEFEDVTFQAVLRNTTLMGKQGHYHVDRVYKNNKYIVQCFRNENILGKKATKAMIRRCDSKQVHSWQDLFRIKNEIFGDEAIAIEVYPKKSELVDAGNLYWLWILDKEEYQK